MPKAQSRKHKFSLPHVYSIVFVLMIICALLTWIVPSGQYDRAMVEGREVTVAGTYHPVEKMSAGQPGESYDLRQGPFDLLQAPTKGIQAAVEVIAFVFIVGGSFAIITKTNAIPAGMSHLIKRLKGKDVLIIPITMILFSVCGTTFGMAEEALPFFAIFIPIMIGLGYDSVTAFMVCCIGPNVGYMAGTINPFNVLIAQGILGISGNPQLWLRTIAWVVLTVMAIIWVTSYARRVRENPETSIMYNEDLEKRKDIAAKHTEIGDRFTLRQKAVLLVFALGMILIIFGLVTQGWYMNELSAVFLGVGIVAGIVGGLNEKEMANEFVNGLSDFAYAAIIIGLARAVLVIAEDGKIIDTVLNALVTLLAGAPPVLFTTILYILLGLLSLLVTSSSGLAALTMPILGPLTELMGLNPEGAVTALSLANKTMNTFSPVNALTIAGLAICGISLAKWWKTSWRFMIALVLVGCVFTALSAVIPG